MNDLPSRAKILRLYTKFLALQESDNPAESTSAKTAAESLREKYVITDVEIMAFREANKTAKMPMHSMLFDYDNMILCDVLSYLPGVAVVVDQSSSDTLLVYAGPQASLALALHEKLRRVWRSLLATMYVYDDSQHVAIAAGFREFICARYSLRPNNDSQALVMSYVYHETSGGQKNQQETAQAPQVSKPTDVRELAKQQREARMRNKQKAMYERYRMLMEFGAVVGFSAEEFSAGRHAAEKALV